MQACAESVERILKIPGVASVLTTAGHSRIGGRGENQSSMTVTLEPWKDRRSSEREVQSVRAKCELFNVPPAKLYATLQNYLGSLYVNDVNLGTQVNRVDGEARMSFTPASLE